MFQMPNMPVDFIYLASKALYCTDKQQGIHTKCHLPKGACFCTEDPSLHLNDFRMQGTFEILRRSWLYVWYISMRASEAHLSLCPWPVQWVRLYQQQRSPEPAQHSSGGWTVARCRWHLWRWGTPTLRWTDWDCPCPRPGWSERRGGSVKIMKAFLIHYPALACFRPKPINLVLSIIVHPHIYMCIF